LISRPRPIRVLERFECEGLGQIFKYSVEK